MAANFKVLGYGHTGITVRSMSNSLRFWRDIIGCSVIWEQHFADDALHKIMGAPIGTRANVVYLSLPQAPQNGSSERPNNNTTLELLEYELPATLPEAEKARTPQARPWDIGAVHICLLVRGLDDILETVKAEGYHVYNDIFTVPQEEPRAEMRGQRICYLKGPDGELVELMDIPKQA